MKATITIVDTPSGNATVTLDFSEPTPKRDAQTAATKIAYEILQYIEGRASKIGSKETSIGGKRIVSKPGDTNN